MGYYSTLEERHMMVTLLHNYAEKNFKNFNEVGTNLFLLTCAILHERDYVLTDNDPLFIFLYKYFPEGHYIYRYINFGELSENKYQEWLSHVQKVNK